MPEYLAPGVYVEEASLRAKAIEGLPTSTAAFAGPTLTAPEGGAPALLTGFAEFERSYGELGELPSPDPTNHLAQSVRAFFENGGTGLYVSPVVFREGVEPGQAEQELREGVRAPSPVKRLGPDEHLAPGVRRRLRLALRTGTRPPR